MTKTATMATTNADQLQREIKRATGYGEDVLATMAESVQRCLDEIRRYQQRYEECNDLLERARILTLVVKDTASLAGNCRMDLAMKAHADLMMIHLAQQATEAQQ